MADRKLPPDLEVPTIPIPDGRSSSDGAGAWNLAAVVRDWLAGEAAAGDELTPRYQVQEMLGRGGMGEVFRARDRRLRRDVALKTARVDRAATEDAGRFLHEAQVTAQLAHPNIPPLHDLGAGPNHSVFFTMRALPGQPLSKRLTEEGAQPIGAALRWFGKVCDAVGYAHSRGVLHRDLKPGNILVGDHGEVYVIDWGLARRIGDDAAVRTDADDSGGSFTELGAVVGTPGYMSPEQLAGDTALDARADIYALGAILYALVAGRPPFLGSDPVLRLKVHRGEYPPLHTLRPAVPWALARIVDRALATRREDRYPTVDALQADLAAYLEGRPVPGIRYPAWRRAAGAAGRWWRPLLGATALAGSVFALGLASVGYHALTVTRARDRAVLAEQEALQRALQQEVLVAQLNARLGLLGKARLALQDAGVRGAALGVDPRLAGFAQAALDVAYPPPEVWIDQPEGSVAMAFSGDRAAFAVADPPPGPVRVSVHDLTTGARRQALAVPAGDRLVSLRFDGPDEGAGVWVLRGSSLVRLDVVTGGSSDPVALPEIPPAGRLLLSDDGRRLAVWDGTRTSFYAIPEGTRLGGAWSAEVDQLSADGRRALGHPPVGGLHRQVTRFEWWDVDRGESLGPAGDVLGGAFGADLTTVVVPEAGGVAAWRGERVEHWTQTPPQPWVVVREPAVVLFGVDGAVEERDLATGAVLRRRGAGLGRDPGTSELEVTERWLVAGGIGAWHLWSRVDLAPLAMVRGAAPLSLDLSPDGALAASTSWSGGVTVWEWRSHRALLRLQLSPEGVRDTAFSPDGGQLVTADREGQLRIVDLRSGAIGDPLDADRGIAVGVWWGPDGQVWAVYEDGSLVDWDVATRRVIRTLRGAVRWPWALEVGGGRAAISGRDDDDPVGEVWDLATGTTLATTADAGVAFGAAVTADGRMAAFGRTDGNLSVIDDAGERALPILGGGPVMSVAFSPSGEELVAGTLSGRVFVLDPRTGTALLDLEGHDDGVAEVAFVPGTRTVLTLGGSGGELHELDLDATRRFEETQLRIRVGVDAPQPWAVALARAELRRDWVHAADAIALGRAEGASIAPARAARAAQGTGDLAGAIRALRAGPDPEVSDPTREIWAAALERELAAH